MNISALRPEDETDFNTLAFTYGTFFNSLAWTNIFGNSICHYGIYNKGGDLIGGFALYHEKKYFLDIYSTPPFTPTIGPFFKVDSQNPVSVMDLWKKVLTSMVTFLESLPYGVISCSLNQHIVDMQPFIWSKFKVIPGYTYLLDLSMSHDLLLKNMSSERRKNISKGIKDALIVKKTDDFKMIKSLVLKTFSRQGKRINEFYLNKIFFEVANNNNSYAFTTFRNDDPIACTFCVYDYNTAYYLFGGYNHESKHHGAGAMSMWESIKHAKQLRLKTFDFEGSMVPQIEKYFRGFGGQLTPYFKINKAKLPLEIILKFFRRDMF